MTQTLLDETARIDLDEAGRNRLTEIHRGALRLVKEAVSPDLQGELTELALPLETDGLPSEPELRVAQAQLMGWLNGVLMGLQAAALRQAQGPQADQPRRQLAGDGGPSAERERQEGRAYL